MKNIHLKDFIINSAATRCSAKQSHMSNPRVKSLGRPQRNNPGKIKFRIIAVMALHKPSTTSSRLHQRCSAGLRAHKPGMNSSYATNRKDLLVHSQRAIADTSAIEFKISSRSAIANPRGEYCCCCKLVGHPIVCSVFQRGAPLNLSYKSSFWHDLS